MDDNTIGGLYLAVELYDSSMTDRGYAGAARSLDALTLRVRAANPSPMTLSGTNTYLLGDPAAGDLLVVDPGPDLPDHRANVEAAVAVAGARVTGVVITHHHADHAGAVGWATRWDVPAWAFDPSRVPGARRLADGTTLRAGGLDVTARHLPGHCSDHLCLQIAQTGVVLSGDHILGEGTTVIAWPDGDLTQYLGSLRQLRALRPTALYPGHGEVVADPEARIDELAAHRALRTEQILAALADGAVTVPEIVARVYDGLDPRLRPAAQRSVSAHLATLGRQDRVRHADGRWHV